ncbi:MAG TPA: NAD-dependent epimerase/dehydratase family protein [Kiritimatiellia bacterium]|nr:NAD-dependent epimerase/dehydratase family protein [Kiritimatiellia bacterium]HMO98277.1 NAD-dependent epimerase/dehydratase family protein [Kiritimatiellia bacterium]HMP96274.1 NAD-dependent epimerase/dehydratase family protein [Kiritimatiellia bacterium]
MSTYLVTGAAGFIGSQLCERLLGEGHRVVGVDCFIPYYDRSIKENNLQDLRNHPQFRFLERDLRTEDVADVMTGCEAVFHLAAMPGLMKSWDDLPLYSSCNILATQRLLEAARKTSLPHFIHISTSSVYGREATQPETSPTQPFSPYGITKLAAENLCRAYEANFGTPVTILRYFSVYGPRQRPDMAYHILIRALLEGRSFPMFGDGEQTRSNTFVADCVEATCLAARHRDRALGQAFNIGGGEIVSLNTVIGMLETLTGKKAVIERKPGRPGDQKHTAADITKAKELLGYAPVTPVREGLAAQVAWVKSLL